MTSLRWAHDWFALDMFFPYVLFLEGSNFLTQDVVVARPDGRSVTLTCNFGAINRLEIGLIV